MRSVGGHGRPAFPVGIGDECIIAPQVALAGCSWSRLKGGGGGVVHAGSVLDHSSRVGLHCIAAPDGEHGVLVTTDIEAARDAIARADFFARAFGSLNPTRSSCIETPRPGSERKPPGGPTSRSLRQRSDATA